MRRRRKKRTWGQLLVEEILRLADTENPPRLDERNAPKTLARVKRFADAGWSKMFPGGRVEKRSDFSALEHLRGLAAVAREFAARFQNGECYDPGPIAATIEQRADKATKGGWRRERYIRFEDDPLRVKVRTALVEALNQKREITVLRCGMCNELFVAIRKDQKHCSTKCSKKAADKEKVKTGRAADNVARSRYAKRMGVSTDQVVTRVEGGRRVYQVVGEKQ